MVRPSSGDFSILGNLRWAARAAAGPLLGLLLAGCAAQTAYLEAHNLSAEGNVEAGLAKYQEAMKLEPGNAEFRAEYLRVRERAIRSFLEQAGRLAKAGRRDEAEKLYERVLGIEPDNERAQAGMQQLARDARHAALMEQAAANIAAKDTAAAQTKLAGVLQEDPRNEKARALLRGITRKPEAATTEAPLASAYRQPVSIDFKDAPLKQVFEVLARSSGLNFVFDKDVKADQKTSIILKDSTIEAALYFLLLTNQLEQQVMDGNTVLIYPVSAQKTYQQLAVRSFLLENAKAAAIADALKTLVKMRDVVVNEKLNMVIVRDSPEAIRLAEKLIAAQDIPEPEVMLEVEVLEVSRARLLDLGVAWPGSLSLTPLSRSGGSVLTVDDLRGMSGRTIGASLAPTTINASKVDTDANILANPRIRVLNHEKAKIVIGNRVPSISASAIPSANGVINSETVTYLDVGLKLDVEPTIYLDDDVAIRVGLEVSNIVNTQKSQLGTVTYTIGNRTANTMLRLKDGENQVLAGLINDEDRRTANKFPALGDIPLLGRLFGSTQNNGQKTEIVLSITPHLIRNIRRPDAMVAEFMSGTETSLRRRPDVALKAVSAPVPATPEAPAAPSAPAASAVLVEPLAPAAAAAQPSE